MQLGHVIHKVRDLDRAVADFEARGFAVEYGRAKKPYNALIYFSHGPYLELLARTGMPPLLGRLLSLAPAGVRPAASCPGTAALRACAACAWRAMTGS